MATGVMTIKYQNEHIAFRVSGAINQLNDVSRNLNGVRKKIGGIPERSRWGDNLKTASSFLRKKTEQYDRRETALETLKTRTNTFMSCVETTEKKLSLQIRSEYQKFHQQTGIGKTRIAYLVDKIKDKWESIKAYVRNLVGSVVDKVISGAMKVGEEITNFIKLLYEDMEARELFQKAMLKSAAALLSVAGAIIGFLVGGVVTPWAIVTLVAGLIVSMNAFVDAERAWSAFGAYYQGDKSRARELDEMSTSEYLFGGGGRLSVLESIFGEDSQAMAVIRGIYDGVVLISSILNIFGAFTNGNFGSIGNVTEAFATGASGLKIAAGTITLVESFIIELPSMIGNIFQGDATGAVEDLFDIMT